MTSLRDQFSAVRKAQLEAQFDFFNSMTSQAFESASRVAALNLAVSRDAVQRSIGAGFALMNSRDPRDVLSLGGQAEEQMRSLFDYGRELLGIASGTRPYSVRPQALALASRQAIETVEVIERSAADTGATLEQAAVAPVQAQAAAVSTFAPAAESIAESASTAAAEAAAEVSAAANAATEAAAAADAPHPVAAFAPVSEPVVVAEPAAAPEPLAAAAEPVPVAEPKAIAKAVGKGSARAAAAPHPAAAPVLEESEVAPKVELPPASTRRKK